MRTCVSGFCKGCDCVCGCISKVVRLQWPHKVVRSGLPAGMCLHVLPTSSSARLCFCFDFFPVLRVSGWRPHMWLHKCGAHSAMAPMSAPLTIAAGSACQHALACAPHRPKVCFADCMWKTLCAWYFKTTHDPLLRIISILGARDPNLEIGMCRERCSFPFLVRGPLTSRSSRPDQCQQHVGLVAARGGAFLMSCSFPAGAREMR